LRVVLQEVRVVANRARVDGGGIAVQGPINGFGGILELQAGSEVSGNSAGGDGGGIALDFATLRMRADRTAIDANSAARGGGIAGFHASASVGNVGEPERQTDASGARIAHNSAQTGGGVYLGGSSLFDGTELALSYNTAYGNGGGFYAEGNSQFQMGRDYPNVFAVQCAPGAACGRIEGNRAGNGCPGTAGFGGGGYADGASVYLHQVEIVNNCAYGSPGLQSWGPRLDLEGVLFAGNRLRGRSIISYDGLQTLTYATRVGAPTGISHLSYVTFAQNLLLKDDGTTQAANAASLVSSGWNYTINAVASADPVPGFLNNYGVCNRSGVSLADFVDAAGGDYRPSPSGALVDACSTEQAPHEYRDPHLLARCQDDPNRNQGGTCDVGAYEAVPSAPADRLFADDFE
jgi:predicted outer membrane repeat protein